MSAVSRIVLKILAFFAGLGAYLIWANGYYGGLPLQYLGTGFLLASAAYVAVSIFSLLSPMMGGLLSLIGTVAGFFCIAWVMDKVSTSVSWLDDERMYGIFIGIATLCMILDIRYIIRSLRQSKAGQAVAVQAKPSISENTEANMSSMNDLKSNPTFVLSVADVLEQEFGRKPTTQEVLDRMEHMRVIDPSEINQS
ncbi:hypothetical protein [Oscillibacter sp.]|uniref:hypothetical protein n=1 Tax=Oscillibacter sp. TaxID=1945593 RepID=UPI002898A5EC|nr:hypothetical protein [Oscillibacter sp.]